MLVGEGVKPADSVEFVVEVGAGAGECGPGSLAVEVSFAASGGAIRREVAIRAARLARNRA
jgi:hypothetical protein